MSASSPLWVFVGDSITADPQGYVGVVASRLQTRFAHDAPEIKNAGVSGDRSVDMLARFERDALVPPPDRVFISVGVNDVWHGLYDFDSESFLPEFDLSRGIPLATFAEAVTSMVCQAGAHRTMLLSPTPIGEDRANRENEVLGRYIAAMEDIARDEAASYCPMNEAFWRALEDGRRRDPNFTLTTDGVHMNAQGVQVMAEALLEALSVER